MYTANIVDTVIFRSLGAAPSPHLKTLEHAVETAGTELWVPPAIYRELTNYGTSPPVNPYLDDGIEAGWIRVVGSDQDHAEQMVIRRHSPRDRLFLLSAKTVVHCQTHFGGIHSSSDSLYRPSVP